MGLDPMLNSTHSADPWKKELFGRLDRIRVDCGMLCQLNSVEDIEKNTIEVPEANFDRIEVPNVNCPALLSMEELDAGDLHTPGIPEELYDFFTIGGVVHVTGHQRRRDIYLGTASEKGLWPTGNIWEEKDIEDIIVNASLGTLKGSYGVDSTTRVRDKLKSAQIRGKSILVIGSSHPWLEAILLSLGAKQVTTLEYGEIISHHPKIKTLTPSQFRENYKAGLLEMFDGVVTHSSIEHSGLGRYGDALNPWGDILAIARAWCSTRDGGFLYLGVPTGKEAIFSNWHRVYGKLRYPLVTINWRSLDKTDESELELGIWKSQAHGGFGYLFEKVGKSQF